MLPNQTRKQNQHRIALHPRVEPKNKPQINPNCIKSTDCENKSNPKVLQIKPIENQPVKIKKISELINKNLCMKKQINLNDPLKTQNPKTSRKKKLDVSLSKQKLHKERSISEKSANKTTKLKISVNKEQSIRKIKSFNIDQDENENIKRIKTPRRIQDLHDWNILNQNNENNNIININLDQRNQGSVHVEKRKIKICRHK